MSVLAERMTKRIKKELDIDVKPHIRRTYCGHWQKMDGAVSWTMDETPSDVFKVASQYTVTELLKEKKWEWYRHGSYLLIFPSK